MIILVMLKLSNLLLNEAFFRNIYKSVCNIAEAFLKIHPFWHSWPSLYCKGMDTSSYQCYLCRVLYWQNYIYWLCSGVLAFADNCP